MHAKIVCVDINAANRLSGRKIVYTALITSLTPTVQYYYLRRQQHQYYAS